MATSSSTGSSDNSGTKAPSSGGRHSSRSARASRRQANSNVAYSVIQIVLGLLVLSIWLLLGTQAQSESLWQNFIGAMPFFGIYALGVLSRYIPGVKGIAKRMAEALPET